MIDLKKLVGSKVRIVDGKKFSNPIEFTALEIKDIYII